MSCRQRHHQCHHLDPQSFGPKYCRYNQQIYKYTIIKASLSDLDYKIILTLLCLTHLISLLYLFVFKGFHGQIFKIKNCVAFSSLAKLEKISEPPATLPPPTNVNDDDPTTS